MTTTTMTITYAELAKRLDSIFLFNQAPELDEYLWDELENGSYDDEDGNPQEVFQWYLITPSDAEYMKRHTDELVFWSDRLQEYIWGVTHWGTSWDYVELEFKEN